MYKWVIARDAKLPDYPNAVRIQAPIMSYGGYLLIFTRTEDLERAIRLMYNSYEMRWKLSECLFDTKEQALWYIQAKMYHYPEERCKEENVRPVLYWVDDSVANFLTEQLEIDRHKPYMGGLDDYLNDLHVIDGTEAERGWTVTYMNWDDPEGEERVVGRFKTTKEKDKFLEKIHRPGSGWVEEELQSLTFIHDYNYMLPAE